MRWIVDAMNVLGSRPDGWWRDRDAALRRLVERVHALAKREGVPATVVMDAGPNELAGDRDGTRVVLASRRGRNAADDEIVALLEADPSPEDVVVFTSDKELADRVRALGAHVEGARGFRERLDDVDQG
jgi:uncharacterized protein YaiI (UPF0178 family)